MERIELKRTNINLSLAALVRPRIILVLNIRGIKVFPGTSEGKTLIFHGVREAFLNRFEANGFFLKVNFDVPIVSLILVLHEVTYHPSIVIE